MGVDRLVGGRRCRPDTWSGDCGEVLERRCPRQLHEDERLRSRDEAVERFGDPVALHDQQEWIEGDRDPSLPFTGGRTRGRERESSVSRSISWSTT
jgi:hypothetical protein